MSAKSPPLPLAAREVDVAALVMIAAAANALVGTVMRHLADDAGASLTFGVSPFQLVALFVAAKLMLSSHARTEAEAGAHATLSWREALVLALILVPSSAVAWAALALYAGTHTLSSTGARRTGALLFLGAALAALWSSVVLKWLALPVTSAEAYVLGQFLQLVRADIVQVGNVVGNPDTHSLILMTRCTSADALPHAGIALVAVAHLLGTIDRRRLMHALLALVAIFACANLVRLGAMAWSAQAYAFMHGAIGANLFDAFQALLVLALGNWASEP